MAHLERPPVALGFSFDGVDDRVEVPDSPSLGVTGAITLEAWVKAEAEEFGLICKAETFYAPDVSYWMNNRGDKRFQFTLSDGAARVDLVGTTLLEAGRWYHVVGRWDGAEMRMFVNGVDEGVSEPFAGPINVTPYPVDVGVLRPPSIWLRGVIALARIYNRALSDAEVSDLYSIRRNIMEGCVLKLGSIGLVRGGGTQWLDESPYKSHGTVYGAKRVRCCHCNPVVDYGV